MHTVLEDIPEMSVDAKHNSLPFPWTVRTFGSFRRFIGCLCDSKLNPIPIKISHSLGSTYLRDFVSLICSSTCLELLIYFSWWFEQFAKCDWLQRGLILSLWWPLHCRISSQRVFKLLLFYYSRDPGVCFVSEAVWLNGDYIICCLFFNVL